MKTVHIKAESFFDLLKTHGANMWDLFAQMIDGEEKQLLFFNEKEEVIAHYVLPKTKEELDEDVVKFKADLAGKLGLN